MCLDDHFSTVTTEPDPNKTQGRVLHPDQPRVLSERESARAQGFPDTYEFSCSSSASRYRQIGNAVPPPLAKQLGLKILEAMGSSVVEMGSSEESSEESPLARRKRRSTEVQDSQQEDQRKRERTSEIEIIDLTDETSETLTDHVIDLTDY